MWNDLKEIKEHIGIVIGIISAVIGIISAIGTVVFLFREFFRWWYLSWVYGDYFLYYRSSVDGTIISGTGAVKWTFFWTFRKPVQIEFKKGEERLSYSGKLEVLGGMLYIFLTCNDTDEKAMIVMSVPTTQSITQSMSILCGRSFRKYPYAAKLLFSKTPIAPGPLGSILGTWDIEGVQRPPALLVQK